MGYRDHPNVLGHSTAIVDAKQSARVRRFIYNVGAIHKAADRLGIGGQTLEAAREPGGRMKKTTLLRLLSSLEREEAKFLASLVEAS